MGVYIAIDVKLEILFISKMVSALLNILIKNQL